MLLLKNYRPGVMDKLGLGMKFKKKLILKLYTAVSGFDFMVLIMKRPGYDIIAQAMGGLHEYYRSWNGTLQEQEISPQEMYLE